MEVIDHGSESSEENYPHPNVDNKNPQYSPDIWLISCRPVSTSSRFSDVTLLFQPDIRLFCHKGSNCEVTNKKHFELYCHQLDPTVKPEKTNENPYCVPNCAQTWTLLETNVFGNDFVSTKSIPENSRILIYVHGHRTRYFRATGALSHLLEISKTMKGCENLKIFGFLWPSHYYQAGYIQSRAKTSTGNFLLFSSLKDSFIFSLLFILIL